MPMMKGTVCKTCPPDVMAEIANKYSFSFMHDGQKSHYWHEGKTIMLECPESIRPDINTLIDGIDRLRNSVTVFDDAALMEFLYKYAKMYAKFFKELERKKVYQVSDIQPIDIESVSLEEQCLMEVMEEQIEKNNPEDLDGVEITHTKDMLDAKIAQKKGERAG
jgi:hypothetical protein